jgi:hypothetical protein
MHRQRQHATLVPQQWKGAFSPSLVAVPAKVLSPRPQIPAANGFVKAAAEQLRFVV